MADSVEHLEQLELIMQRNKAFGSFKESCNRILTMIDNDADLRSIRMTLTRIRKEFQMVDEIHLRYALNIEQNVAAKAAAIEFKTALDRLMGTVNAKTENCAESEASSLTRDARGNRLRVTLITKWMPTKGFIFIYI